MIPYPGFQPQTVITDKHQTWFQAREQAIVRLSMLVDRLLSYEDIEGQPCP